MAASIDSYIYNTLAEMETQLKVMKASENLEELSQKLQKMRSTGDHLHSKMAELKNCRNSAIYSLPNEILALIFAIPYPDRECIEGVEISQTGLDAMLISQVSRRWRDVAIRTPCLWANIPAQSLDVELYLERSGTRPLDIDMNFDDSTSQIKKNLPILKAHVARWRTLCIMALKAESRPNIYQALLSLSDLRAPHLTSVYIGIGHEYTVRMPCHLSPSRSGAKIFGAGAPMLSSMRVKGLPLSSCCPPLQAVTRLELLDVRYSRQFSECTDYSNFQHWLSASTSLQDLVINPNYFSLKEVVEVPSLHSLEFSLLPNELCDERNLAELCTNLIATSLASLTLTFFTHDDIFRFGYVLCQFQCFPAMQLLTLCNAGDIDIHLIDAFPNITELTMSRSPGHTLLTMLSSKAVPLGSKLWPDLHTIAIDHISNREADLLCDLVSCRSAAGQPLRCIRSFSFKNLVADKLNWLQQRVKLELL